eukprot:CAMPEP_0172554894 /NCGR_PEP_ID=MMETSP1067-20121228/56923_1 /TAXON_ID=265564 ORGANISM="Thalassiosira punctigera, Strain Tpunct2005C2" /NCGR_SAMPLE_ID=MMETSP1067 /ASSEMBLY_ACC=CAM_ASM_000444 /LENGTH=267 /DNA_ID=CAMNT_0013343355 /DNA_START=19 /DNA_END=822 /DNA_ORIENTATION=+
MMLLKASLLVFFAALDDAGAFNLPGLANIFKPPPSAATTSESNADELQLLQAISNTGNGKDADIETQSRVLSIVRRMETSATPSSTLLSNPEEAKILDGDWFLQYTAPSEIENDDVASPDDKWVPVEASGGEAKINTRQFGGAGAVSGGGIPVDASSSVALQSFDIEKSRVTNEIQTGIGLVTVGGKFRESDTVPLRAIVAFDTAKIALNVGPTIDISFLFDIRAAIKGTKEAGWVETTYVTNDMRIGRGNKGSLFILTRDRDAVKP